MTTQPQALSQIPQAQSQPSQAPPKRRISRRPLPLRYFLDDPNDIALHRERMRSLLHAGLVRGMWAYLLARAGYSTLEQIDRAEDAALLMLPQVGPSRVAELRTLVTALLRPPAPREY